MGQPSLELGFDDPGEDTWGVADLNRAIAALLRRHFPEVISVRGEISGLNRSNAGHVYFDLCEQTDAGISSLRVALFSRVREGIERVLARQRMKLANGMQVRISGTLDHHQRSGITLKMSGIDLSYTLGLMAQDRERVLRQLVADGLFDLQRRLALGVAPLTVGLVASRGTAGGKDFVHELRESGLAFKVVFVDARVQGEGAAESIAAALRTLARRRDLDVIALVRGGGSRTDLAVFDHELVARTVATAGVPVLTGVGHQIDVSITDQVAHASFKTPTACAAHLVERVRSAGLRAEDAFAAIARRAGGRLDAAEHRLAAQARRIATGAAGALDLAEHQAHARARRLRREADLALAGVALRTEQHAARLGRAAPRLLVDAERQLDGLAARVSALDPARILARGWSITRRADGGLVRSPADVAVGDDLVTTLAGGTVHSRVGEPPGEPSEEQR